MGSSYHPGSRGTNARARTIKVAYTCTGIGLGTSWIHSMIRLPGVQSHVGDISREEEKWH